VVVHNGVDVDRFRPASPDQRARARAALSIPPDAPAIGTVCRLDPMKGVLHLLEAFLRVRERVPRAVLVVAGDGSQRQTLIDAAEAAGASASVRILGYCEDVPAVHAALDVFATFSRVEGFGLANAEAMAAGLPVVATDVPGTREVIEAGRTGLLFPYGDWAAGAEALTSLIEAPERAQALARAGRAHTQERWSIQQRDEAMRKFFELALGTPTTLPLS
jgi:glycosyltransferase involved in cell wall biosynthesis